MIQRFIIIGGLIRAERSCRSSADPAGPPLRRDFDTAPVDRHSTMDCLRRGNRFGAAVCQVPGDWEGLPTAEELESLNATQEDVVR